MYIQFPSNCYNLRQKASTLYNLVHSMTIFFKATWFSSILKYLQVSYELSVILRIIVAKLHLWVTFTRWSSNPEIVMTGQNLLFLSQPVKSVIKEIREAILKPLCIKKHLIKHWLIQFPFSYNPWRHFKKEKKPRKYPM